MEIRQITEDKDNYLEMLLIADPQENMIRRYLDKSDMFVLEDAGEVLTIGVVEPMKNKRCELKNLVTSQEYRRQGYGTYMVNYLSEYYSVTCDVMYVGTGNNSNTLDFYKQCGFVNSHIVANFFVDYYEKPIYENGIQLTDMIYLKKNLDVILDVKRVVDMAMHAGRILLKNGGEIFRVEETINRIARAYGIESCDPFVLSSGFFLTADSNSDQNFAWVRHIPLSATRLDRVTAVNQLSREIEQGIYSPNEAYQKLQKIQTTPPKAKWSQILASGIGSGCFCYLFGGDAIDSIVSFIAGLLLYVYLLCLVKGRLSKIATNISGGMVVTLIAVLIYQMGLGHHLNEIIIGAIIPLVPGVAFTNGIRDIADQDYIAGAVRMLDALLVTFSIAMGVGLIIIGYHQIVGSMLLP